MITPESLAAAAALLSTEGPAVTIAACPPGERVAAPSATLGVADVPPSGPTVADYFLRHVAATFARPGEPGEPPPPIALVYSLDGYRMTIGAGSEAVSPPPPPAS